MWDSMDTFSDATVYLLMGGVATLLFLIRLVMSMFGSDAGGSGDFDLSIPGDVDVGGDVAHHADSTSAFQFFSVLSITAFFMGAGWMGLAARSEWELSGPVSALLAIGFGVCMMLLASGLSYGVRRLSSERKYDAKSCIGVMGSVYARIPPKGQGRGQVTVNIHGAKRTVSASSTGPELAAFTNIRIVAVEQDGSVLVEPS